MRDRHRSESDRIKTGPGGKRGEEPWKPPVTLSETHVSTVTPLFLRERERDSGFPLCHFLFLGLREGNTWSGHKTKIRRDVDVCCLYDVDNSTHQRSDTTITDKRR